jgi:hypothetical protein
MMANRTDLAASILLDIRSAWLVEFASGLARQIKVNAYAPSPQIFGLFSSRLRKTVICDPELEVVELPIQRGYFSFPLQHVLQEHRRISEWIRRDVRDPSSTWLVCCYPHYAKVAAIWPGPTVYYPTDLFSRYEGRSYRNITGMEKDLCKRASLVCPNSRRIADYLVNECACERKRILVLPNAVRHSNLLSSPAAMPSELPPDCEDLSRPVAGVIGNMGANINWILLEDLAAELPWLSWLMVGPTSARISDIAQLRARTRFMAAGGRIRFVGHRPYGELKTYARSFDVAVLPYMKREPTFSGSSTRFYEHLAACRPILATDGFAELLDKEPLLKILRNPDEWIGGLNHLRERQFSDGLERARWLQSQQETWQMRAQHLREAMLPTEENGGILTAATAK